MKNKGCRDSQTILQDFTQMCAELGGATHRMKTLPQDITKIHERLTELQLELNEAKKQEIVTKEEPPPQQEETTAPTMDLVQ